MTEIIKGTIAADDIPDKREKTSVMRLQKGDIVYLRQQRIYAQIEGFFKLTNGNWSMRLGIPQDQKHFKSWCRKNPHKVKMLDMGMII